MLMPCLVFAQAESRPTSLEAPEYVRLEDHDREYIYLRFTVPQSVKSLVGDQGVFYQVDYKINSGDWQYDSSWDTNLEDNINFTFSTHFIMPGGEEISFTSDDIGVSKLDYENNTYYFRVRLVYPYYENEASEEYVTALSPFSEIVSIGKDSASGKEAASMEAPENNEASPRIPALYNGASSWAVAELDKAVDYGFVPDSIRDNMAGYITREEFSEIAVRLYEKLTGVTAEYSQEPFSDTTNPEISKAYELGIVKGVGGGKFAPGNPITRQEISVMLFRTMKMCRPQADFTVTDVAKFTDEAKIASWAIDAIHFMFKNGIIKGTGDGSVSPLINTTRQEAVLLVVRTYEKYMN
jgi:hypothetical protein